MSQATSLLGTSYAKNFRDGFLLINEERMRDNHQDNHWIYADKPIFDQSGQQLGDIDAGCVITQATKLSDLLQLSRSQISEDHEIAAGTLLLVEATNKTGQDLIPSNSSTAKLCYVDKKIAFHLKLQNGGAIFTCPPNITGYYLLLIYNGAEHNDTFAYMKNQLSNQKINGSAVWCANDAMNQWPTKIQLDRAAKQLEIAEEEKKKAEEEKKKAEEEKKKAVEEKEIAEQETKKALEKIKLLEIQLQERKK
jgi:hypothetical protein